MGEKLKLKNPARNEEELGAAYRSLNTLFSIIWKGIREITYVRT